VPFVSIFAALIVTDANDALVERCLGHAPDHSSSNRWAAAARLFGALVCSPHHLSDGNQGIAMFAWIVVSVIGCVFVIVLETQKARYWKPRNERANTIKRERRKKRNAAPEANPPNL
jgi:hypothetical protein